VRYQWRADRHGRITWVDPIRAQYLGPNAPTAYQEGWLDLLHPDDRDRVRLTYETAIRCQTAATYRCRVVGGPFNTLFALVTMKPACDEHGGCAGFLGATRLEVPAERHSPEFGTTPVQNRKNVR
jgi:PAS domain-containing protein